MGVGAGLSMYVVVVQKFTFAISSPDEFLYVFSFFVILFCLVSVRQTNKLTSWVKSCYVYRLYAIARKPNETRTLDIAYLIGRHWPALSM